MVSWGFAGPVSLILAERTLVGARLSGARKRGVGTARAVLIISELKRQRGKLAEMDSGCKPVGDEGIYP